MVSYLWPKRKGLKTIPFGAAYTYMPYKGVSPPTPFPEWAAQKGRDFWTSDLEHIQDVS